MKRLTAVICAMILALASLAGCGSIDPSALEEETERFVCYLNSDGNGLIRADYEGEAGTADEQLDEFINLLQSAPENTDYSPLLPSDVRIVRSTIENGSLTVDFSADYEQLEPTREVLARAGIVRTLVQVDGVSRVIFTVDGQEACTPGGEVIGPMDADSFVEDDGNQINAIQHTAINLYFTNEAGTALTKEARSIYYSASKPLEWAIVERIIAGPKVDGNFPTVPSTTQIISVTSANGICYVNLTQTFVTNALPVDEQIPIYSIVNSVIDDCRDITAVQIAIDGDSNIVYRQGTDLSKPFEADMSLVE